MRRAALYARFSTDLQSDRSAEDQLALCAAYARAQGLTVAESYEDRARSGTTTHGREGLAAMLADARAGRFDVIVVEALDRLSRDQEDLAGLHKRLTFMGLEILAVHDGRADALQVGIRGLVSSLWIADLKHKIRRGMGGRVRDGKLAGGRAYGYRPVPGAPGQARIEEAEAAAVRRIFEEYVAGRSPREIAVDLNRDGIPGPRGAAWNASTINGNGKRGHGILRNPLYSGRLIWNRVRMIRDPDTGRRVSRPNPPSEWQAADVPAMAIIPPDLWQAAHDRREGRSPGPREANGPFRRRLGILSGLMRCGQCGGSLVTHDRRYGHRRARCANARDTGRCDNRRKYRIDAIERAALAAVSARLSDSAGLAAYLEGWQEERRAESRDRAKMERAVADLRAKIDRMARMLVDGKVPEDFFDREMPQARAELARAEARLAEAPDPTVIVLHPAAVAQFRADMADLAAALDDLDPDRDRELIEACRSLITAVTVHDAPGGGIEVETTGILWPLVRAEGGRRAENLVAEDRAPALSPLIWGRAAIPGGKNRHRIAHRGLHCRK